MEQPIVILARRPQETTGLWERLDCKQFLFCSKFHVTNVKIESTIFELGVGRELFARSGAHAICGFAARISFSLFWHLSHGIQSKRETACSLGRGHLECHYVCKWVLHMWPYLRIKNSKIDILTKNFCEQVVFTYFLL